MSFAREIELGDIYNSPTVAFDVTDSDVMTDVVQALDFTMDTLDRVYLCTNEIGLQERAMCIKFKDENKVLFNPQILRRDGMKLVYETDYNTGKKYIIPRYTKIGIAYQDCFAKSQCCMLLDDSAIVVCRGIDCLDGIHDEDYGLEITEEFEAASEEDKLEVINAYLENLVKLKDDLDKDLSTDENTKKQWDHYKFNEAVRDGKIEFEDQPVGNRRFRRFLDKLTKRGKKK